METKNEKTKLIKADIFTRVFQVLAKTPLKKIIPKKSIKRGFQFFQHPIFFILRCCRVIIFMTPLFIILYFTGEKFLSPSNQVYLFLVLFLILFANWSRHYIFHRLNSFLLTQEDGLYIFETKGLFSLEGKNVPFNKIGVSDMQLNGILSHFFNLGDILISTTITANTGSAPKIELLKIANPEVVLNEIKIMNKEANNEKTEFQGVEDSV